MVAVAPDAVEAGGLHHRRRRAGLAGADLEHERAAGLERPGAAAATSRSITSSPVSPATVAPRGSQSRTSGSSPSISAAAT